MKLTTIRLFAAIPFVLVGTALSTTLAAADAPTELTSATVPSPPPPEFAPLTRSERLSKYLGGLVDEESIFRAAASAGIRQAKKAAPNEWGGGAEGSRRAHRECIRTARNPLDLCSTGYPLRCMRTIVTSFLVKLASYVEPDRESGAYAPRAARQRQQSPISFSRIGSAAGAGFISRAWQPREHLPVQEMAL